MHILAIPGSLRAASINAAFCRTAALLAPAPLQVAVFDGLGHLPLFNPDLEAAPPVAVQAFRQQVGRADALLIASPEYAHGIAGPMKNALDWLVSFEGTVGKPVALVNTSPRARHAHDSLREVLRTMSADIIVEAVIPLIGISPTEDAMRRSPAATASILAVLDDVAARLGGKSGGGPQFTLS